MARIPDPAADNPIAFLVSLRFPEYAAYVKDIRPAIKGRDLPLKPLLADQRGAVRAYTAELKALSAEELSARVAEAKLNERQRYDASRPAEEENRFYNRQTSAADFRHWAKMSYWSPDEVTALSLGKDPTIVNWPKIAPYRNLSEFVREYERRNMVVTRAKVMRQLWEQTPPNLVAAWAKRMAFELPADLVSEIEALGVQIADWKDFHDVRVREIAVLEDALARERDSHQRDLAANITAMSEYAATANETISGYQNIVADLKRLNEDLKNKLAELELGGRKKLGNLDIRERESLLKLVIGMAIDGYGFDRKANRSPTARELSDQLQRLGLTLSDDTIRNYLTEAKELVPDVVADQSGR